jgi:hypothetical protein
MDKDKKDNNENHENNEKTDKNDKNDNSEYPVGYKRPPRHTQFKPGQSGNSKGRPKKSVTFADVISKQLRKIVTITIGGKPQRITMLEAIGLKQVSQAVNGNHKSTALLLGALKPTEGDHGDHLPELIRQFRLQDAANEAADRVSSCLEDTEQNAVEMERETEREKTK